MKGAFVFILPILVVLSCSNLNRLDYSTLESVKNRFRGVALVSLDTVYENGSTLEIRYQDSLEVGQLEAESMVNFYLIQDIRSIIHKFDSVKIIIDYPNIPDSKNFEISGVAPELEKILSPFSNDLFNEITEFLMTQKGARKDPKILFILSVKWAQVKNGNLDKSWSEDFYEVLFPFCIDCLKGEKGKSYKLMKEIELISKDLKAPILRQKMISTFERIFEMCNKNHPTKPIRQPSLSLRPIG